MRKIVFILLLILPFSAAAQLKYLVEDFEGFANGSQDLKLNGTFTFGNMKASVEAYGASPGTYAGDRYIRISQAGGPDYGGWGKGIGANIEMDVTTDYLNFYFQQPQQIAGSILRIELQEDDNADNTYKKEDDDSWIYELKSGPAEGWQLVSIPLSAFRDANQGGDYGFNISYDKGKLLGIVFSFSDAKQKPGLSWAFDFLSFSKGKLPTGSRPMDAPSAGANELCSLGAWSKEGNTANFIDIAKNFEGCFGPEKKLGVIHFFQPFSVDGGNQENHYPSIERINKVIHQGYVPMITLEDHFVNSRPGFKQPNLYSIVEGHVDNFFAAWAKEIKQVEGVVLLRILHEFNGDWYPWCIVNNDKDPELFVRAYRHIHDIFKAQGVQNVKFIWCPNSMSIPQEKWNYIMKAYPGDPYVDYVGMDIYNGAGKSVIWRSFRKEGIENYFIATQHLSHKPFFICEVATREREAGENALSQDKAGWIEQMSQAIASDMSKVKLLVWFNEKQTFKVNTSVRSREAFYEHVWKKQHFTSGTQHLKQLIGP